MANYTLNFDNAYADCLNVTLINFKANADYIKYAFSITQITLNISKASYLIHIASSNIRICTQSDLSAYSNSFDIAITQGTLNIGGAKLSISFTALIIQAYSYCISIIDSKALSIAIIIRLSIDFSGSIVWLYIVRVCVREPILLQFIADILWILLLVILRLLVMRFLILILMEFLLVLVAIILRLLLALLHGLFS